MSVTTAAPSDSPAANSAGLTRNNTERQLWMSVLSMAPALELQKHADALLSNHQFEDVRTAEIGLAQVRGRMGGTGNAFNLGDMTLTRCVVRSSEGHYGYSYVSGRDKSHARRAAELDALLQSEQLRPQLIAEVIEPLQQLQQARDLARREKTESTRVNFFTLVRGED